MPDFLPAFIASVIGILQSSFLLSAFFFIPILAVRGVRDFLVQRSKKMSWVKSVFLAIFAVSFLSVFLLNAYFNFLSFLGPHISEPFSRPILDYLILAFFYLARTLVVSLVVSILLLPLAFIGSFLSENVSTRLGKGKNPNPVLSIAVVFISTWIVSALVLTGILLAARSVPAAIIHFIFFAFW